MKVLLTGASGFVGSHTAHALVAAGFDVRVSLRASSDPRYLAGLPLERVSLDVSSPKEADTALAGVQAVVHAAGVTRAPDAATYFRVNAEGTRALAAAAQRQGVTRFVLVSSLEARGPDQLGQPDSPYGASKQLAETLLQEHAGALGVTVLRPAGVYGPRDRDLLPLFQLARLGVLPHAASAHPLQPVYATDVAGAVVAALRAPPAFGPFAVAEPRSYRWDEVSAGLGRAVGRAVRRVRLPDAVFTGAGRVLEAFAALRATTPLLDARRGRALSIYSYTCDPAPTEAALGWRARVPLAEGLILSAAWYREQGWLR